MIGAACKGGVAYEGTVCEWGAGDEWAGPASGRGLVIGIPPHHWRCPPRGRVPPVGGASPGRGSLAAALAEVTDDGDDDGEGHHGPHWAHLGPHQSSCWGGGGAQRG